MQNDDKQAKAAPPEAGPEKRPTAREAELGEQKAPKRAFTTTSAPSLALPKGGGAIRGMGETFRVNSATGTASFSLPLPVSPAPRGPTPELSLSYDSGSGNGVFGLGWSLSLPQISRKTDKKVPQYLDSQDSDVFLLSGAEDLVPMVDGNGVRVVVTIPDVEKRERYRPRVEGLFSVIERITDLSVAGAGNVWWRATTRDNVTSTFGRTSASRIEDPSQTLIAGLPLRTFTWLLNKTEDNLGNVVEYFYDLETSVGSPVGRPSEKHRKTGVAPFTNRYLKRVTYGNTTMHVAAPYKFEVVLDYGEHSATTPTPGDMGPKYVREDIFSSYRAGFELRTYRLCKRVLMFHHFTEINASPFPSLVKSLDFTYTEGPRMTKLASATLKGYTWSGTQYEAKAMPPVSFSYSSDAFSKSVKDLDRVALADDFPRFAFGSGAQWVDLDGEGLPGVLISRDRSHRFKRNLGSAKLAGGRPLASAPAISEGPHQVMDIAGSGTLSMVSLRGTMPGYQERVDDGWGPFVPFKSFPRINLDDANTRLMDLNGDGFEDIVSTRSGEIEWYPSLGRDGYGPARRMPIPADAEQAPRVAFADPTAAIFTADMSGDGLADIVRVTHSGVCYWPNLGHGRFGACVRMDSAPWLGNTADFDARRVRLGDLDGTGTADLLYFGPSELHVYRNQSGNSFSAEEKFWIPPEAAQGAMVDLLGTGTTSIVWSPRNGAESQYAKYWDAMDGKKPHLLTDIDNHCGKLVHFKYAPSTKHYLADRKAGRKWPTKLPFPVYIVESVESYDAISRTRLTSSYTYHHGHYDSYEREFRGFGYVEQLDAERFGAEHGQGSFPSYPPPINGEVPQWPVLTKTWFSTGAWREKAAQTAAYQADYWSGDGDAPPHLECALPTGLTPQELREGWRALRGSMIRQEVFELDNTLQAAVPYAVTEKNYDVRKLQAPQKARGAEYPDLSAVFHMVERETRSWAYERVATDPRVSQTLALDVDAFGIVTRSAAVAYKRRGLTPPHAEQDVFRCVVTEQDVFHCDNRADGHRVGIPTEARAFELTDSSKPEAFLSPETIRTNYLNATLIGYHEAAGSGLRIRQVQREKAIYYNSAALPAQLPTGQADPKALLFKSYLLDLTDELITQVFGARVTGAMLTEGGYLAPPSPPTETGYWLPSGHALFDAAKFYLPTSTVDALGSATTIVYDVGHTMFATTVTAPLGNVVSAVYDYRVLAPIEITDPNGNRQAASYDKLGMIEAVAVMGKTTEPSLGDTIANPTMKWEYDLTRWDTGQKPNFVHTFARKVHGGTASWQETYVYTDGSGRVAMTKVQAEPGDAPQRDVNGNLSVPVVQVPTNPRWVGSGRTVVNNKGNAVKQYEPYFSSLFEYESEPELVQTGVTAVITYDGLGRVKRTDFPDGSYARVERTPWLELAYDQNDTVDEDGNLWKEARLPAASPTAAHARALEITLPHKNTPTQTHSDVMGRPFLVVAHNKTATGDQFLETRTKLDIEGQVLEVKDPLGRTCQTSAYSMAGALLKDSNIDKGVRWRITDVMGAPLRRWDERDQVFRHKYDVLRRPTHLFMKPGAAAELLLERIVYGDSDGTGIADPKVGNLRGKPIRHFDGAGRIKAESYDFKGNSLTSDRILAASYTTTVDWISLDAITSLATLDSTAAALLETEPPFAETRVFDALNRITSLITPDNSELLPVYNEASLLNAVNVKVRGSTTATSFVANIDYDAKGQRTKIQYSDLGSGARFTTDYTYDELTFRLTKLKTLRASPANTLQELSYTFDPSGNIVQVDDAAQQSVFFDDAYVVPEQLFEYDAVYRLLQAKGREHKSIGDVMVDNNDQPIRNLPLPTDPTAMREYTENYLYDVVGNLVSMQHVAGVASWTRNYTYTAGTNRLATTSGGATYTHDVHGNMTVMPHLPTITYSPFDQMKSAVKPGAGTVYFTYDGSGQRVRKVWEETASIKHERIYLGSYEIFRKRVSGVIDTERQTLHVMDGVQRIAMVETKTIASSAPVTPLVPMYRYQLGNHLGSAMLEVDEAGLVISYEEYHPYGTSAYQAARSGVDVSARRYRYTGKERDDETGLFYNGARYLAAWLGRWTSADPIGMQAGVNLYQYCRGSPINYVDPSGTEDELPKWAQPAQPIAKRSDKGRNAGETIGKVRDVIGQMAEGAAREKPVPPGNIWDRLKSMATPEVLPLLDREISEERKAQEPIWRIPRAVKRADEALDAGDYATATEAALEAREAANEVITEVAVIASGVAGLLEASAAKAVSQRSRAPTKSVWLPPKRTVPQGLTEAQFEKFSQVARSGTAQLGDKIAVHGSRATGTAVPGSDIDVAIVVSEERFNQILKDRFKTPNPGSAKEDTMLHAIRTGKIQAGEAGLRPLRRSLEKASGMEVDISVIRAGGPFDQGPYLPLKR